MALDPVAALQTLRHGEEHARRRTVAELAGSGSREAIAPLLVAVGDESWAVRQAAIEALAQMASDALLPALEAALRDGELSRANADDAYRRIVALKRRVAAG